MKESIKKGSGSSLVQADGGLRESHQIWALTLPTCPGRIQAGRKYRASAELGPRVGPAIDSQYVAETERLMLKKQVATCTKLEPEPISVQPDTNTQCTASAPSEIPPAVR